MCSDCVLTEDAVVPWHVATSSSVGGVLGLKGIGWPCRGCRKHNTGSFLYMYMYVAIIKTIGASCVHVVHEYREQFDRNRGL